ncbi:hypothetical protein CDV31_003504 [Fusarium ambrosium]|uniref:Uncharacterized protein n=1 Tax=Fusarium ambrosium TaxID=131363 RepID=A0A428UTX4_9HYPO|nr:hypothetical protein CDV31_003504 [Fusarium ambrosium]
MTSTHTGETIPPIMDDLLMALGIMILITFLFMMALLFSLMEPCEMARSADQKTCIICAELDDPGFCVFVRVFFIISIGCSIIAIAQCSLRDLNASHFAFMAAGAATTGYLATRKLRETCYVLHYARPR